MVYTMISCEQRETHRAISLASLAALGIKPETLVKPCSPPSQDGQRVNSREALALAGAGEMVFFEDDIIANARLPAFIGLAREAGEITHFYLAGTRFLSEPNQRLVAQGRPMRPGLYAIPPTQLRSHFGTQATYLPAGVAAQLLTAPHWSTGMPFDIALRHFVVRGNKRALAALPNPVQHQGPPNLAAPTMRAIHRSHTFELGGDDGAHRRNEHVHRPS